MRKYDPKSIEPKWQQVWADTKLYAAITGDKTREKYYMLTEFPYPSGAGLHAGHTREYTLGDVMARHKRMQGYNVLYPMGYDAFGLPTENYAIKNKIAPQQATAENVATFRGQFDAMGFSFDWDREVNTTDPEFYKWTQWLFLKFYEAGLAYQAEMPINWCPKEKTGLANEEVVNGVHERCGTPVEKKLIKQWMFRITDYADRLIEGLKTVDYPPRIADQQVNWIGRSTGASVTFPVNQSDEAIEVFTTAHDTIFGVTFMVLAPEHPLVGKITTAEHKASVNSYIKAAQAKSEIERQDTNREKTGVFTGAHATNPINGEAVPVWIADYVLAGYGTGAIMAVPGHDARDQEFAQKYSIPIKYVATKPGQDLSFSSYQLDIKRNRKAYQLVNSGEFDGLDYAEAYSKILDKLVELGCGQRKVQYKLRDWIFSRQHYWGEPIPVIHCPKDGVVPVPENQLPVTLPVVENYEPTDTGESPLAAVSDWVNTTCPTCGGPAKRETDTMPNWAGSNWYYLRYIDPHNDQAFASSEALEYWRMVDLYLGGMEHTTLHLLYSRFVHQFLYDQGFVPTPEPYAARRGQGIVLAADGRKMSKSIGNVINPTDIIATHGADTLRLYIMFMAPYDETTPWSEERLNGVSRFMYRVWTLAQDLIAADQATDTTAPPSATAGELATAVDRMTHKTIKKVNEDLENMRFNTSVSALMEYVNFLNEPRTKAALTGPGQAALARRTVRTLILLLAPAAPHIAEELWHELGEEGSVHVAGWPKFDPELIKDDLVTVIVQVNGRVRSELLLPAGASDDELKAAAHADAKVAAHLEGQTIIKTIVVPRKLVNFVVKGA